MASRRSETATSQDGHPDDRPMARALDSLLDCLRALVPRRACRCVNCIRLDGTIGDVHERVCDDPPANVRRLPSACRRGSFPGLQLAVGRVRSAGRSDGLWPIVWSKRRDPRGAGKCIAELADSEGIRGDESTVRLADAARRSRALQRSSDVARGLGQLGGSKRLRRLVMGGWRTGVLDSWGGDRNGLRALRRHEDQDDVRFGSAT
jgi:hypothetical protein